MIFLGTLVCLHLLIGLYSNSEQTDGPGHRETGKSMENIVKFKSAPTPHRKSLNYEFSRFKLGQKVAKDEYCKNIDSPLEAEVLLVLGE